MLLSLLLIFVTGYLFIAFEVHMRLNKAAVALLMCGVLWCLFAVGEHPVHLQESLLESLGDTCEVLVYLLGAMTVVNIIESHGGFAPITRRIVSANRRRLLWVVTLIAFFMSALLDNMTTSIVLVMLLRHLVPERGERLRFVGAVVVAANCGGAWSPIGDITTIMLWMNGNVSPLPLIRNLLLPCVVATLVGVLLLAWGMRPGGGVLPVSDDDAAARRRGRNILCWGVGCLLFVPLFKELTGLPPYLGMMMALGVMWLLSERVVRRMGGAEETERLKVASVLRNTDLPTLLFFLGILMSVDVLEYSGILRMAASWLNDHVGESYLIAGGVGLASAVVDNVPLVAACMGMYPLHAELAGLPAHFVEALQPDGLFWQLLTYAAGVGGSLLVIGSAAGVVAMGLEKITFGEYLRRVTPAVAAGYLAGGVVIYLEQLLFAA